MMKRTAAALLPVLLFGAAAAASPLADRESPARPGMTDFFHFQPTAQKAPKGWVLFLPGWSGLKVFDDADHYYGVARSLNAAGFDVLLADFKPAYNLAPAKPRGTTGQNIAWVAEQAVAWMRERGGGHAGGVDGSRPGAIVAWALGAQGALRIANDPAKVKALGIVAAALYYPSIEEGVEIANRVPLLVQTGETDDIVSADEVRLLIGRRALSSAPADLFVYPEAGHGFDIRSVAAPRRLRIIPVTGPLATLQYQAAAARQAEARLVAFLAKAAEQRP